MRAIGGLATGLGLAFMAAACMGSGAAQASVLSAMVVMGPDGVAEARVVADTAACPAIKINGRMRVMRRRAGPERLALRPTLSDPKLSKASDFPVTACEARLPPGAREVRVVGQRLPTPRPMVRRIVVIGDTGCRLKAADAAYQACNDPAAYPFARIAAKAAAWRPDLVIHVGDYEYRENPCAADKADCAGSPWGYGWDAWKADFFDPAKPLLAAAPWIAVRGNHEDCARAGQGWMRFIDPRPLTAETDCNDPAHDDVADDAPPYAVPLGDGVQVVVLDMTKAGAKPTPPADPRHAQFAADYAALDRLSRQADYTIVALHKPILGFAGEQGAGAPTLQPATAGIQSVFAEQNPALLPKGVGLVLSGHVHLWQQLSFASDHPSQFITGFSGTQEDVVPMPKVLPPGAAPAPGTQVEAFSSWVQGFGFMTLERRRAEVWDVKVWNLAGEVVNRCRIEGRHSRCERPQVD